MRITLASIFRDSSEYLGRYFSQVAALRASGFDVRLALAEGDSNDDTYDALEHYLAPGDFLTRIDHGGPRYGSIDHPQRWNQIAQVVSGLLHRIKDPGEALVWVESDLIWTPQTLAQLVVDLYEVPAVAPMVLAGDTPRFYDVWGYRKDGARFAAFPPYWPDHLAESPGDEGVVFHGEQEPLVPIDSCGSCFVASPKVYDDLFSWSGHWPYRAGGELWLDSRMVVRHP